jgi:hypothetical protein
MTPTRLVVASSLALLFVTPPVLATRGDTSAADLAWYLLDEGKPSMELFAPFDGPGSARGPLIIVATYYPATVSSAAAAIQGASATRPEVRTDYTLRLAEFDCAVAGRQRTLAHASYLLDSYAPTHTNLHFTPWESVAQEGAQKLWRIACAGEARGNAMPRVESHADVTQAYRQRQAATTRQADTDVKPSTARD